MMKEPAKQTCGKCLIGAREVVQNIITGQPVWQMRCGVDGQYRGRYTGCKLTDEQLLALIAQIEGELRRRYP